MEPPAVTCLSCERAWRSPLMVEGLRSMGKCPRCGGELAFAAGAPEGPAEPAAPEPTPAVAPHLVLGIPRL
jgi:hypothetical protein